MRCFTLLRSSDAPDEAQCVAGDIYLVTSKDLLEKALPGATDATLRVYMGYAGWGTGQLEDEVEEGAWHIFRGDAKLVFDADPESLWPRMIRETELHVASVFDAPSLAGFSRLQPCRDRSAIRPLAAAPIAGWAAGGPL